MMCSRCGEREATIHEVVIDSDGERAEEHLCEVCAQEAGVNSNVQVPIAQLISSFVVAPPGAEPEPARPGGSCPTCGLTYGEFRKSGLLGCEACYDAFADRLTPLLQRAHEGGTHHVGRAPKRGAGVKTVGASEVAARVAQLRRQLAEAVRNERYERAAQLQREIDGIETISGGSGNGGTGNGGTDS
ncbi:MAG: UvrB/UvrC motif-containing protein [Phycisphaerales bacterium]